MDFIIGREAGEMGGRLKIKSVQTKREYFAGYPGSVPQTVSREHCKLTVNPQTGETRLQNIKYENSTWVNGVEIVSQRVKPEDKIELGCNHFAISLNAILDTVGGEIPKIYSIKHLEKVWKEYHDKKKEYQVMERKASNNRSIIGIISPVAMLIAIVPIQGIQGIANTIRIVAFGLMGVLAAYFYFRGKKNASAYLDKLDELEEQFHRDYVCPNPSCQRFMGNVPYSDLVKSSRMCPVCRCNYES